MPAALPATGELEVKPVWENLQLVAPVVEQALLQLKERRPDLAEQILVSSIPEELADTEALTQYYSLDPELSVNCILVAGKRAGDKKVAACAVRATTRADVNHTVKQLLDVRKASFMSQADAVDASGMEYGGITPIGLPEDWRLLIDRRSVEGWSCIGSGLRTSKLFVTGEVLEALPNAEIVAGLATPIPA